MNTARHIARHVPLPPARETLRVLDYGGGDGKLSIAFRDALRERGYRIWYSGGNGLDGTRTDFGWEAWPDALRRGLVDVSRRYTRDGRGPRAIRMR